MIYIGKSCDKNLKSVSLAKLSILLGQFRESGCIHKKKLETKNRFPSKSIPITPQILKFIKTLPIKKIKKMIFMILCSRSTRRLHGKISIYNYLV